MDGEQYRERSDARLLEFLTLEIGMIETLIHRATITAQPESRQHALNSALEALQAIRKFEGRIVKMSDRERIHDRADELEKIVASLRRRR